jgi:hypothetical protein
MNICASALSEFKQLYARIVFINAMHVEKSIALRG